MSVCKAHGVRCSSCHSDHNLEIEAVVTVTLYPDGAVHEGGDVYWNENSSIYCSDCHHGGTVHEFQLAAETFRPRRKMRIIGSSVRGT